ncbi:MAG: bifunctional proline dehydrogenase/L-glutamate gamma-semialdehyde dehydrogenase PutA [Rhodobacteraceae bacterium]|nr:bifunctional proline dehydrogenase/L-glutamate gamma-semialdehyde dehydrogenase PutA [Paracoccaceae bacterium]
MSDLAKIRETIRQQHLAPEHSVLDGLRAAHAPAPDVRASAQRHAEDLVSRIRSAGKPGLMEIFMAEYGLSTSEGIALMCLAEALLRVPDADTIDALIEDKIAPSEWEKHLGHSSSSLVNASTWALMLTGQVLKDHHQPGTAAVLRGAIKRLGEPVIRTAVQRAIKELGHQFVLGRTIDEALKRGAHLQKQGYTFSYDMLGEAALTAADAQHFYDAYAAAIASLAPHCTADDIRENPGISIKLSALHPRYEEAQRARVMDELVSRAKALAIQARKAGMGLNIDAEEAARLDLSLDVIEAVLSDEALAGWDGFGVVVQAYGKRAAPVLDWLHALAEKLDRKIMVRLVKGAYWDTEVKLAQVEGLADFPVFTRKVASDVSYICCAKKLLGMTDRIYPQLATHNAHTVAAILEMAEDKQAFEFQRLQGMGDTVHGMVHQDNGTRCRIYAPVGPHRDLLAYLVRRLLENGANSSFVNQIMDESVPPSVIAADPFDALDAGGSNEAVIPPADLFAPERTNSRGFDLTDPEELERIDAARSQFAASAWTAAPRMSAKPGGGEVIDVTNPARPDDKVGTVTLASGADVDAAVGAAKPWAATARDRAAALNRAADLYEENFGEFFALLCREAGKALPDAVAEIREAVDFLRYYAAEGVRLADAAPRGVMTCISPWNFPLAIFTGQIAAALAAGNAVLAKPAESTMLTADLAVRLMHEAGVPVAALQLLPGEGGTVGRALTSDPRVAGVTFTGSLETARLIERAMAETLDPSAPLVAETGGLNAMIVDSTALPEQAIRDILMSGFRSAGQRCSALRVLYLQEDIAEGFLKMLYGAMDELIVGDPWALSNDIGPVIDATAQAEISAHVEKARAEGRLLKQLATPETGHFIGPAVIRVGGIADVEREIFGPVVHVATFRANEIDKVIDAVNASGYGLTFGMHSRINERIERVTSRLCVGNMYVNRNQIGAIVGSQPFGGEGLSGTGPKAGGPRYVQRFTKPAPVAEAVGPGKVADPAKVAKMLQALAPDRTAKLSTESLPGPTGESNQLSTYGRGVVLCLGPTPGAAERQARIAAQNGCMPLVVVPNPRRTGAVDGFLDRAELTRLDGFDAVALWSEGDDLKAARQALASRDGRLIPLMTGEDMALLCQQERHVCIDTTAAGGNAALLAAAS